MRFEVSIIHNITHFSDFQHRAGEQTVRSVPLVSIKHNWTKKNNLIEEISIYYIILFCIENNDWLIWSVCISFFSTHGAKTKTFDLINYFLPNIKYCFLFIKSLIQCYHVIMCFEVECNYGRAARLVYWRKPSMWCLPIYIVCTTKGCSNSLSGS